MMLTVMTALLVSIAIALSGQTQLTSLYRQVVSNPTGNNGYEEYLMACDILRESRVEFLTTASPQSFEEIIRDYESPPPANASKEVLEIYKLEKPSLEQYETAKKYRSYTVLQLRREALAKGGRALDLLNRGNKKPVFDPREKIGLETLFPEYAQMKGLARLATAGAYVAFADGQSARGTQYLCDIIIVGQNLSEGPLIGRLVGVAIQSISLATFERLLPNLSAKDAAQIEALAPKLIQNPPAVVKSLLKETQFTEATLDRMFDLQGATSFSEEEDQSVAEKSAFQFITKLSDTQRKQVIELCRKRIVRHRERILAAYRRPESQWGDALEEEPEGFPGERSVQSIEDLVNFLSEFFMPLFAQAGNTEIRNRTQLRLLGLAGSIIRYKWEHDRWPIKLSDAVGEKGVYDPINEDEFQYAVEATGFRVYSKGTRSTGEIALKYRRQTEGTNEPPPPFQL